jgi:hypothetical protein
MNIIRVALLPDFMWGDDVVLLAMDGVGWLPLQMR